MSTGMNAGIPAIRAAAAYHPAASGPANVPKRIRSAPPYTATATPSARKGRPPSSSSRQSWGTRTARAGRMSETRQMTTVATADVPTVAAANPRRPPPASRAPSPARALRAAPAALSQATCP